MVSYFTTIALCPNFSKTRAIISISFNNVYMGRSQSYTHACNENLYAMPILCMWAPHLTYVKEKCPWGHKKSSSSTKSANHYHISDIDRTFIYQIIFLISQSITSMGHARFLEKLYLLYYTISSSFPIEQGPSFTHSKGSPTLGCTQVSLSISRHGLYRTDTIIYFGYTVLSRPHTLGGNCYHWKIEQAKDIMKYQAEGFTGLRNIRESRKLKNL